MARRESSLLLQELATCFLCLQASTASSERLFIEGRAYLHGEANFPEIHQGGSTSIRAQCSIITSVWASRRVLGPPVLIFAYKYDIVLLRELGRSSLRSVYEVWGNGYMRLS